MFAQLRAALSIFVLLTIVTGVAYPLLITVIAQSVFPHQADGSLIVDGDGQIVGSSLIGQPFDAPKYFWSRPSATGPVPYNAAVSSGSNLGPTNPALSEAVTARVQALQAADPDNKGQVPVDLVTASGSGLDPHIQSGLAAEYQVSRGGPGPRPRPGRCSKIGCRAHRGPNAGCAWRSPRERARSEPQALQMHPAIALKLVPPRRRGQSPTIRPLGF